MTTSEIIKILLGLQIGLLLTASSYVLRIAKMHLTPTSPYLVAMVTLILMCIWRLDKIFHMFSELGGYIITTVITIGWLLFFTKIYSLLKNKNE